MLKPRINYFREPAAIQTYRISPVEEGLTIYEILRQRLKISRRLLRKLRHNYRVRINGLYQDFSTPVKTGDLIELNFNFQEESSLTAEPMNLDIIYEDENLLVINKPAGMLVHPAGDEKRGTLANGVIYHLRKQNNYNWFRLIHRLDRNTSGLILIGKNQYAHNYLTNQFIRGKAHREYLAFVRGVIGEEQGMIDAPIGRTENSIIKRQVDFDKGKRAITHFKIVKRYSNATMVSIRLETGRTHQIRVHFSYLGHPLLGDTLYGGSDELIQRHALHSYRLICRLPLSHEKKEFTAALTPDLQDLLAHLSPLKLSTCLDNFSLKSRIFC